MKLSKITYEKTGYFTNIIIDYLNGSESLQPFYNDSPDLASIGNAIQEKKKETIDRQLLANLLIRQYANQEVSYLVQEQIDALRNQNTFCVVTAHQLNIFTGPLYVIYKTLSTIRLCEQLKKEYEQYNFVPVFWLGSEDHDFEEINHFNLFGKTYAWGDKQGGACGRYEPQSIKSLLAEITPVLGTSEYARELIELFTAAYTEQPTLSQSTRYYLNKLFGEYGLVIVDGDDIELKKMCSNIVEDELMHQTSFSIVNKTLTELPFPAQANPREINLFYLKDGLRERILRQGNEFTVHGTSIQVPFDELLTEVDEHPERFSPNVILRPLFQQKVLPAVAFVGGGGEIAYWLQLKALFEHYHISFPVLVLRNSFLWVDGQAKKKMNKLNLPEADLFKTEDALIRQFIDAASGGTLNMQSEEEEIKRIFDQIMQKAVQVDSSLDKTVLAERQSILNSLEKFKSKIIKVEKAKLDNEVQQIKALKSKLFPGGQLQERSDNFMTYYLKYGGSFIKSVYDATDPLDKNFTVITEE